MHFVVVLLYKGQIMKKIGLTSIQCNKKSITFEVGMLTMTPMGAPS